MGKLLPVERSYSPYRYVTDNLAAVRAEYLVEAGRLNSTEGLKRLQRLLTMVEVLTCLRDGFRVNGWDDGKKTRVLARA